MQIFILDGITKKVVGALDTQEGQGPISNDKFTQYLDTGAYTYEFDVTLDDNYSELLQEKNYIIFSWKDKWKLLQIENTKDVESVQCITRTIYAVPCSLELYQTHIRPMTLEGTIKVCLTNILQDTNFKVGYISSKLRNVTKSMQITTITPVYTVLQDLISIFDGIELDFRVECKDSLSGKYQFYIDVYANGERGNKTYKRIEYDWNEYGLTRETDGGNFYSGLIAQGVNGVTFTDIEWDINRGDPLNKPRGQDYLVDPDVHAMYNNGGKYILGSYTSSTASTAIDLLWETYYKLQEVRALKINFDAPLYLTSQEYQEIDIGDTVHIVNPKFNPPVQLEARIGTLILSFTDSSQNKATFTNYKPLKSKIRHYSTQDIISEAVNTILGIRVGKLTDNDKIALQNLLAKLNVEKEEVDKIIQELIDKIKPDITNIPEDPGEDLENYEAIKINHIDGGLWIGDKRIYDIKNYHVANIDNQTTEDIKPSTKEYQEAIEYYARFDLGKNKNNSTLAYISSSSNKYKIPVMVNYWCGKFGLDPQMVYMLIMSESTGDPYCATSYSGGGYGLLQCERDAYFGIKQTIKFLDGTTKSFTPSYSTMQPRKGGYTTINGVSVDTNINNQIMFGCHELRYNLEMWHYNIFATLIGFNMGIGAMGWILNKYVCDTYGYTFNGSRSLSNCSTAVKNKAYEVLESYQAPFASYRKDWQDNGGKGTLRNIELYLRYYNPKNNNLPYALDSKGNKIGYGVSTPAVNKPTQNTGASVRQVIVDTIEAIVQQHKRKEATYDQSYRTWNFKKPRRRSGTFYGCKNPICYDCSSAVTCCYTEAGLKSIVGANNYCSMGTLVAHATAKPGYMMWKVDTEGIKKALPGDIVMDANFKVTPDKLNKATMTAEGATHHTMIYRGVIDGKPMVSHASKWAYPYDAIKTSPLSYYQNKGTAFFLRPYDLVEADNLVSSEESTGDANEIIIQDTIIPGDNLNCITIKGLPGATADLYIDDNLLISNIQVGTELDDLSYPVMCDYIFIHFGIPHISTIDAQNVINLVEALLVKYPKTPIFVAKEWYATSIYEDYENINTTIDTYNLILEEYCNKTDYVIFLDIGDLPGTTDGYSCKDKNTTQIYYSNVKEAIKGKVLGYAEPEEIKATKVDYVLKFQDDKDFGLVSNIFVKCVSDVKETFWAKYKFTTCKDSEPTIFTQSAILYLEGDDCINGGLIPKPDTKYSVIVMANPDRTLYGTKKYYGVVTANHGDGKYTDCGDFIGRDKIIEIANSYFTHKDKFIYNTKTPLSFSNPEAHKSEWMTNGKFHIDCSTFINLLCRGIPFEDSPYATKWTTKDRFNKQLSWTFNPGRTAADIAKYCVEHGWVNTSIDLVNFSNIEKGDLIFWDRDGKDLNRYMSVSHVGICNGFDEDGDPTTIEVTTVANAVYKRKLKDNQPGKVILVARIRKD